MRLGGIERIEELLESLGINSVSGVTHRQPNPVRLFPGGDDQETARTIIDGPHRVGRIEDEIQNDLLKLDTICADRRQADIEIRSQGHTANLKLARCEGENLAGGLI